MPRPQGAAATEVVDPVCGMTIAPDDAVAHVEYDGQTYHFCSDDCRRRFAGAQPHSSAERRLETQLRRRADCMRSPRFVAVSSTC